MTRFILTLFLFLAKCDFLVFLYYRNSVIWKSSVNRVLLSQNSNPYLKVLAIQGKSQSMREYFALLYDEKTLEIY